jgi:hypothetical protein
LGVFGRRVRIWRRVEHAFQRRFRPAAPAARFDCAAVSATIELTVLRAENAALRFADAEPGF